MVTGIGARIRAARNTYLFVEASPRVAGHDPGVTMISFGFEQRAGGHMFQLNFSNGFGTTLAQVARGGTANEDWYLGFNLSRKFLLMTKVMLKGLRSGNRVRRDRGRVRRRQQHAHHTDDTNHADAADRRQSDDRHDYDWRRWPGERRRA